ncbi:MAG: hypothetical protein HC899_20185 [Leptolyngbyaceae cyanobacterium SM1_4_3]|nr:hypothetical protein [Leptolyngbyaceae cyanobacterium SM1_4_3]
MYVWNPGYSTLQQLVAPQEQIILQSTTQTVEQDILQFLLEQSKPGIYLLEEVLHSTVAEMSRPRCYNS